MFIAISSFYIIAALIVILMLGAAFVRNHQIIAGLSFGGMLFALVAVLFHCGCPLPNWAEGFITADKITWIFLTVSIIGAMFVNVFSFFYLQKFSEQKEEFYVMLNTSLLGTMIMVSSTHFITFFLGLELLSIPLFVMIGYLRQKASATEAAIKYLTLSGASTAAMLFGFALIYAGCGQMSLYGLGNYFMVVQHPPIYVLAGAGLFIAAMGFKLALAPFHMWTADVYQGAPSPVTAFIASISKGGALIFMLRFFTATSLIDSGSIYLVLGVLASLSMFVGNLLALWQNNVKRILAYSSISHMGYVLIAIMSNSIGGSNSAIFYMISYFITTIAAFGVISALSNDEEPQKSENFVGLYYRKPLLAIVFSVALLSLAGMPLTAGFIAKILLAFSGAQSQHFWLVWVLIINSGIGLFYYIRLTTLLFKKDGVISISEVKIPVLVSILLTILLLALIAFGVAPGGFLSYL